MEMEVLHTVIQQINKLPQVSCRLVNREIWHSGRMVDAELLLKFGKNKMVLNAEVKNKIVPAQIPTIIETMGAIAPVMILAQYISPRAKELLRKEHIPYADAAGNIYLAAEGIYLFVDNKKPQTDKSEDRGRAFTKAGLKVVYQFLLHPAYINRPYRFIGKKAKVSIRTVGTTLESLMAGKFLLKKNKQEYILMEKEKLLQRWVTEYNRRLRPKLAQRRFRWRKGAENWKSLSLPPHTFWGGPAAAEIMTDELIADAWTIYTGLNFMEVMEKFPLLPDENGNVELLQAFWNDEADKETGRAHLHPGMVHPILVYADLIEHPNLRYAEAANVIYREYVEHKL